VKIFVAKFLSGLFKYQTQKPKQDSTSGFVTPATLHAPILSAVIQIARWSTHWYSPITAKLLYMLSGREFTKLDQNLVSSDASVFPVLNQHI